MDEDVREGFDGKVSSSRNLMFSFLITMIITQ